VTPTTGRRTASPQSFLILDSLQHQGHDHAEVLRFGAGLLDQEDEAQVHRDRGGVVTTAGLDLGPRWPRGLRRLLGGR
jgi:hypothetical protein